jgi:hypothetical protein
MIVRAAHADVVMRMAFSRSVAHWHGEEPDANLKAVTGEHGPILLGKHNAVAIDGNRSNSVSAPDGGLIHIYGDLTSNIAVAGHSEIIIAGDIRDSARIIAAGICHLFVGGKFSGELSASGSTNIWVELDFDGTIKTGSPSTELYVGGDYRGNVIPSEEAALFWMTVRGFASKASLSKIVASRYTQFHASVGRSDVAPGLYPISGGVLKTTNGSSYNRWCVQLEDQNTS